MAYVVGGIIENEDYNGFIGSMKQILNDSHSGETVEASANYGYGQNKQFLYKNDGDIVRAAEWDDLVKTVTNIARFQGTTIGAIPTAVKIGDVIEAVAALTAAITLIDTNRLNALESRLLITTNGAKLTDTRTGGFTDAIDSPDSPSNDSILQHVFTARFTSWDQARYFFNAGGQIRLSPTYNTSSTNQSDNNWKTLFNKIQYLKFTNTETIRVGTPSVTGGLGFYNLTNYYQTVYTDGVSSQFLRLQAKLSGAPGLANTIIFRLSLECNGVTSNGTVTNRVDTANANEATVTTIPPIFATTIPFSAFPDTTVLPNATITALPTQIGERQQQQERLSNNESYLMDLGNVNALSYANLATNDPEYVEILVDGVVTIAKYAYDTNTSTYKLYAQNKKGLVEIERPANLALTTRNVKIHALDVQIDGEFSFTYVTKTIFGDLVKKVFTLNIENTMFSWADATQTSSYSGSNYDTGVTPTVKGQLQFGGRGILVDEPLIISCGAAHNGFYIKKCQKSDGSSVVTNVHSLGNGRSGEAMKVIKASTSLYSYVVIGKCVDEIGGEDRVRGFIAFIKADLTLYTGFNGTGYYIDDTVVTNSSFLDVLFVPSSTLNTSYKDRFVVLASNTDSATESHVLYAKTFSSTGYDSLNSGKIYTAEFPHSHTWGFPTLMLDAGVVSAFIPDTGSNPVQYDSNTQSWKTGIMLTNLGSAQVKETIMYEGIIQKPYVSSYTDSPTVFGITKKLRDNESYYPSNKVMGVVSKPDSDGNIYIAQTYKMGNLNQDGTYTNTSYGFKVSSYKYDSPTGVYKINQSFSDSTHGYVWYSKVSQTSTTYPVSSSEVYIPIHIEKVGSELVVAGTYRSSISAIAGGTIDVTEGNVLSFMTVPANGVGPYHQQLTNTDNTYISAYSATIDAGKIYTHGSYVDKNSLPEARPAQAAVTASVLLEDVNTDGVIEMSFNPSFSPNDGLAFDNTVTMVNTAAPLENIKVGSKLGSSVAISQDGSYAVAGAPRGNGGKGQVNIYLKDNLTGEYEKGGELTLPTEIASLTDTATTPALFGHCVDITDNGEYILVSAMGVRTGIPATPIRGKVYLYKKGVGVDVWSQVSTFYDNDLVAGVSYGFSCSISGDAMWIAVGSPQYSQGTITSVGKVMIYKSTNPSLSTYVFDSTLLGNYTLTANDINRQFGAVVKLSSKDYNYTNNYSGHVLAISRPFQKIGAVSDAGAVDIYHTYGTSGVFTFSRTITNQPDEMRSLNTFGYAFSLSQRGTEIAIAYRYLYTQVGDNPQVDIHSFNVVANDLVPKSLHSIETGGVTRSVSLGHDGRTIVIGQTTPQIHIYHKIGKDVEGTETYVYQKTFSSPSDYDPADSGQGYGIVEISKLNNNIIVGAPLNDTYAEDAQDDGKVYFYNCSNNTGAYIKFLFEPDSLTTVVENTSTPVYSASGTITITSDPAVIKSESVRLSSPNYSNETYSLTDTDNVFETQFGMLVVTKISTTQRRWEYYPTRMMSNAPTNSNVSIDLRYEMISTSDLASAKYHTISVIDGKSPVPSVFVPSVIDNSTGISYDGALVNYRYHGFVNDVSGSDDIVSRKLSILSIDANDDIQDGEDITYVIQDQAVAFTANPAVDFSVSLPTSNGDREFSTTQTMGVYNGGVGIATTSTVSSGRNTTLKDFYSLAQTSNTGGTTYVVTLNGVTGYDHFTSVSISGVFYGTTQETIYLAPKSVFTNGQDGFYVVDYTTNTTTFTFGLGCAGYTMLPGNIYTIRFVCGDNHSNFIAGYYGLNKKANPSSQINAYGVLQDIDNGNGSTITPPDAIYNVQTVKVSGYSNTSIYSASINAKFALYATPPTSTVGAKLVLSIQGDLPRNYIEKLCILGIFAYGDTPLKLEGAPNQTFIKDSSATYIELYTDGTTESGSNYGPLMTQYKKCTTYSSNGTYTRWEWESSDLSNLYGMMTPSEAYSVNFITNNTQHTLYKANTYGRNSEYFKVGYDANQNYDKLYDKNLQDKINSTYYVSPRISPPTLNNNKIIAIYTNSETSTLVIEVEGSATVNDITTLSVSGQMVSSISLSLSTTDANFKSFTSYSATKTFNSKSTKTGIISKWEWTITANDLMVHGKDYTFSINSGNAFVTQNAVVTEKLVNNVAVIPNSKFTINVGSDTTVPYYGYVSGGVKGSAAAVSGSNIPTDLVSVICAPSKALSSSDGKGQILYQIQMTGNKPIDYFNSLKIEGTFTSATSALVTNGSSMFNWNNVSTTTPLVLSPLVVHSENSYYDSTSKWYVTPNAIMASASPYQPKLSSTSLSDAAFINAYNKFDRGVVTRDFVVANKDATLTPVQTADVISSITVTNGGTGYSVNDAITISGAGTGATAIVATTKLNGAIDTVSITNGGTGYTTGTTAVAIRSNSTYEYLGEANKPFLHDYFYEATGNITTWQFVVGAPVFTDPSTNVLTGRAMVTGNTYTVSMVLSSAPATTYDVSVVDNIKVGKQSEPLNYQTGINRLLSFATKPSTVTGSSPVPITYGPQQFQYGDGIANTRRGSSQVFTSSYYRDAEASKGEIVNGNITNAAKIVIYAMSFADSTNSNTGSELTIQTPLRYDKESGGTFKVSKITAWEIYNGVETKGSEYDVTKTPSVAFVKDVTGGIYTYRGETYSYGYGTAADEAALIINKTSSLSYQHMRYNLAPSTVKLWRSGMQSQVGVIQYRFDITYTIDAPITTTTTTFNSSLMVGTHIREYPGGFGAPAGKEDVFNTTYARRDGTSPALGSGVVDTRDEYSETGVSVLIKPDTLLLLKDVYMSLFYLSFYNNFTSDGYKYIGAQLEIVTNATGVSPFSKIKVYELYNGVQYLLGEYDSSIHKNVSNINSFGYTNSGVMFPSTHITYKNGSYQHVVGYNSSPAINDIRGRNEIVSGNKKFIQYGLFPTQGSTNSSGYHAWRDGSTRLYQSVGRVYVFDFTHINGITVSATVQDGAIIKQNPTLSIANKLKVKYTVEDSDGDIVTSTDSFQTESVVNNVFYSEGTNTRVEFKNGNTYSLGPSTYMNATHLNPYNSTTMSTMWNTALLDGKYDWSASLTSNTYSATYGTSSGFVSGEKKASSYSPLSGQYMISGNAVVVGGTTYGSSVDATSVVGFDTNVDTIKYTLTDGNYFVQVLMSGHRRD